MVRFDLWQSAPLQLAIAAEAALPLFFRVAPARSHIILYRQLDSPTQHTSRGCLTLMACCCDHAVWLVCGWCVAIQHAVLPAVSPPVAAMLWRVREGS